MWYHWRMDTDKALVDRLTSVLPHLNERQRRLYLAAEARALGYGGLSQVSRIAGVSRPTLNKALRELDEAPLSSPYARKPGGGRTPSSVSDTSLLSDLEALLDPDSRGDPESVLRWTCKSTRQLAQALGKQGHRVSHTLVGQLLKELGFSLQANRKTLEGSQHPDRDAQFAYINALAKTTLAAGQPVVSLDAKKKELVGSFKNGGREWRPQEEPEEVNVHDFMDSGLGKAIPYGVYDIGRNRGWVNVGIDHDTAAFAVESVRRWWRFMGKRTYPQASQLLINCDAGGSNGYRVRLWKAQLQRFANATGLSVTVTHLPPGTSKWNKIEHRLFSYISINWRGRPLVSHEVIVQLIGATTTGQGLRVKAMLDTGSYPTNVVVSDEEMAQINILPHAFHGEWNYTISPTNNAANM